MLSRMNDERERFFSDLHRTDDAKPRIVIDVNGREVVAGRVRSGEWTLTLGGEGRVGRVFRRQEGRAVYFVGFTEADSATAEWISDDVDRVLDRLVASPLRP